MRFILSIVDDFKLVTPDNYMRGFPPDIEFNLKSYIDMEVEELSLYKFNNFLKELPKASTVHEFGYLPLLTHNDYETLRDGGYAVVKRMAGIKRRVMVDNQWILVFDIYHERNRYLLSIIRNRKLSDILKLSSS